MRCGSLARGPSVWGTFDFDAGRQSLEGAVGATDAVGGAELADAAAGASGGVTVCAGGATAATVRGLVQCIQLPPRAPTTATKTATPTPTPVKSCVHA